MMQRVSGRRRIVFLRAMVLKRTKIQALQRGWNEAVQDMMTTLWIDHIVFDDFMGKEVIT